MCPDILGNSGLYRTRRTRIRLNKQRDKGVIKNVVIPATRITARVSVVSRELSVRTRAAIAQTTGSKL